MITVAPELVQLGNALMTGMNGANRADTGSVLPTGIIAETPVSRNVTGSGVYPKSEDRPTANTLTSGPVKTEPVRATEGFDAPPEVEKSPEVEKPTPLKRTRRAVIKPEPKPETYPTQEADEASTADNSGDDWASVNTERTGGSEARESKGDEPASRGSVERLPNGRAQRYTLEEIRALAQYLANPKVNKRDKVWELTTKKYGLAALPDLPEHLYDAFMAELQAL
jgi:hypothetical protein